MTTQIDIIESKLNFGIGFIKSEQRLSLFEKNDTQWLRLGFYVLSKKRDYANTHFRKTADKSVVIEQAVIDYFQPKNIIKHAVVSYLKQCLAG